MFNLHQRFREGRYLEDANLFLDKKPLTFKPWLLGEVINKQDVVEVTVWVKFLNLDLGCWGSRGVSKVASLLGRPLMADKITQEKNMLNYARVLI